MSDRQHLARLHEWIHINGDAYNQTFRMRVPGGWLYRHQSASPSDLAMVFVPDRRVELKPLPAGQPNRRKVKFEE